MKWFKHDTDSTQDAKIKKLLIRYGAVGYAIYFHCLELIAGDLSESNITYELEHDSEIIADNLKIKGTADQSGVNIVEEIMSFMIELGLFVEKNLKVYCYSMLKRLDSSMTSNKKMRALISKSRDSHDPVMIESCKKRTEEKRIEENRIDTMTKEQQSILNNLIEHNKHNIPYPRIAKEFKRVCKEIDNNILITLPGQYIEYLLQNKGNELKYIKHIANWLKDGCYNLSWIQQEQPKSPVYYQDLMYEFRDDSVSEDRKREIISELTRPFIDQLIFMGYDIDKYRR